MADAAFIIATLVLVLVFYGSPDLYDATMCQMMEYGCDLGLYE